MQVDGKLLIHKMQQRMDALQKLIDRDISGNTDIALAKWHETKFWKESIERGEFLVRLWEQEGM